MARLARGVGDRTVALVRVVGVVVAGDTTKTTTVGALTGTTARATAGTATTTAVGVRNAAGHVEGGCSNECKYLKLERINVNARWAAMMRPLRCLENVADA